MATELTMPRLSQDMESGRVVEWLKKEGDRVEPGEPVLTVETDKANMDVEATEAGFLVRILVPVGTDAMIGAPLAVIGAEGEDVGVPTGASAQPDPASGSASSTSPAASHQLTGPNPTIANAAGRDPASPVARRVARELGIDIGQVRGSGQGGLISEADVRAYADRSAVGSPSKHDDVEVVPLEGIRRRIADRMSLSRRTAADVTTVIDVDMSGVANARQESHLSYTTYVAWAVARTLPEFPDINATFVDDQILRHRTVSLGVAVALDSGLVVVVVRDAGTRTPVGIEAEIDRLATQARQGKIKPEDVSGASFTLTNSGTFGSLFFTPIINVPEVAILGVGRVADVPVIRDGQVVPGKVMYLCLSYDHRVVDGSTAVRFLAAVKRRLEDVAIEIAK